jgi:hypothetical protein
MYKVVIKRMKYCLIKVFLWFIDCMKYCLIKVFLWFIDCMKYCLSKVFLWNSVKTVCMLLCATISRTRLGSTS